MNGTARIVPDLDALRTPHITHPRTTFPGTSAPSPRAALICSRESSVHDVAVAAFWCDVDPLSAVCPRRSRRSQRGPVARPSDAFAIIDPVSPPAASTLASRAALSLQGRVPQSSPDGRTQAFHGLVLAVGRRAQSGEPVGAQRWRADSSRQDPRRVPGTSCVVDMSTTQTSWSDARAGTRLQITAPSGHRPTQICAWNRVRCTATWRLMRRISLQSVETGWSPSVLSFRSRLARTGA